MCGRARYGCRSPESQSSALLGLSPATWQEQLGSHTAMLIIVGSTCLICKWAYKPATPVSHQNPFYTFTSGSTPANRVKDVSGKGCQSVPVTISLSHRHASIIHWEIIEGRLITNKPSNLGGHLEPWVLHFSCWIIWRRKKALIKIYMENRDQHPQHSRYLSEGEQ